ncbi:hypothetical protein CBR_g39656 [Chara braunii]|uniref:Uncharacterized protein n=1 Tax=Chara braunii TaxID=69332 RepID=A0A388K1H5_CHABU|nr:hypothetical protein CBR_g39656 [Chara braunii]|eukprot:GBG63875.1 hypothetical protein CBR_g39656 [Chara braunii]
MARNAESSVKADTSTAVLSSNVKPHTSRVDSGSPISSTPHLVLSKGTPTHRQEDGKGLGHSPMELGHSPVDPSQKVSFSHNLRLEINGLVNHDGPRSDGGLSRSVDATPRRALPGLHLPEGMSVSSNTPKSPGSPGTSSPMRTPTSLSTSPSRRNSISRIKRFVDEKFPANLSPTERTSALTSRVTSFSAKSRLESITENTREPVLGPALIAALRAKATTYDEESEPNESASGKESAPQKSRLAVASEDDSRPPDDRPRWDKVGQGGTRWDKSPCSTSAGVHANTSSPRHKHPHDHRTFAIAMHCGQEKMVSGRSWQEPVA